MISVTYISKKKKRQQKLGTSINQGQNRLQLYNIKRYLFSKLFVKVSYYSYTYQHFKSF